MVYPKIIQYCTEHKMSIAAFEQMCGIGNDTIDDWAPDQEKPSMPSLKTLEKIEKATGISIAELVSKE